MIQRIYLAGPMTGLPEHNFPAFHAEAARLRSLGYQVENPAENPAPACGTWAGYMRKALAQLVTCNAIALLPGWPSSRGANIERSLAFEMGMKGVMAADIAAPIGRESAATLVCASTANSGLNQANELSHSDVGARSSGRHPSIIRLRLARSSPSARTPRGRAAECALREATSCWSH